MTTAHAMRAAYRRPVAPLPRTDHRRLTLQEGPMPRRNTSTSSRARRRQAGRTAAHTHRAHAARRGRIPASDAARVAELLGIIRPDTDTDDDGEDDDR